MKGSLVYLPAEVTLMQFNKNINDIDPEKTYIGPSPMKVKKLKKPTSVLIVEINADETHFHKILYEGQQWYVDKKDVGEVLNVS